MLGSDPSPNKGGVMKRLLICVALWVFIVCPRNGLAQEMAVDDIVNKANLASYYAGADGSSDVTMTITDAQGRDRQREFRILRMDVNEGQQQKFYVYFYKPSDVARMGYMVWKHLDKDDDRWLYLPALDLVRRIAASDKRSSFVGSHFVYEDVSGRGVTADDHELIETTDEFYVVNNTPKETSGVEFASYKVWIRKDTFLPVKAEYYDADGELMRSIEALSIEDIQGYPTVIKSVAKDLVRNGQTVMEFSNIQYDIKLTESIFAERYLRQPPTRWINR